MEIFGPREVKVPSSYVQPQFPKKCGKESNLSENTICFPIYKQLHMIYNPACLLYKQLCNLQDHKVRGSHAPAIINLAWMVTWGGND